MIRKLVSIIFVLICCDLTLAQENLEGLINKKNTYKSSCVKPCLADSILVLILDDMSWELKSFNVDSALYVADEGLALATKIKWTKGMARLCTQKAICLKYLGRYPEALNILDQAVGFWNAFEKENPRYKKTSVTGIIKVYFQYGAIHSQLSKNYLSIEDYKKAILLAESIKDEKLLGGLYANMAVDYNTLGDYIQATELSYKAIKIFDRIKDERSSIVCLNTMGAIYLNLEQNEQSLTYYNQALARALMFGDEHIIGDIYNSLANNYQGFKHYDKAINYRRIALEMHRKNKNDYSVVGSLIGMSDSYYETKQYDSCLYYARQGFNLSSKLNSRYDILVSSLYMAMGYSGLSQNGKAKQLLNIISDSSKVVDELSFHSKYHQFAREFYQKLKDDKQALWHYEKYIIYHDSMINEKAKKGQLKQELKYEYEKKAAADSLRVAEEKKLTTIKLKQEQTQRYYLYGGLGLTIFFGIFMFNRFKITDRQKSVIEEQKLIVEKQKHIVDEKQKEILDSIRYAKRIQQSLLPTDKYLDRILRNNKS